MKFLILMLMTLSSSMAYSYRLTKAELREMSCAEAKEFVKNYQVVDVEYRLLGFKVFLPVYANKTKKDCEGRYASSDSYYSHGVAIRTTKDTRKCFLGTTCVESGRSRGGIIND